jgi:AraC-like DNA-binding protein
MFVRLKVSVGQSSIKNSTIDARSMYGSLNTANRVASQGALMKVVLVKAGDVQFVALKELISEVLNFDITFLEASNVNRITLHEVLQFGPDIMIFSGHLSVPEYALIRGAKNALQLSDVPIIVLSDARGSIARVEAYKAGVDQFMEWPFSKDEVRIRINNSLRRKIGLKPSDYEGIVNAPGLLSIEQRFLANVLTVIEENIGNSNFNVVMLAKEMNLSRAQFFRRLKLVCHLSPNLLINEIRLRLAATMIRERTNTITQICYEVGFNDQSYFAKRFKRKFGVSPKQYGSLLKKDESASDDVLANLWLRF